MRPDALVFEPSYSTIGISNGFDCGQDSFNDSLLNALVKEREDHSTARLTLEAAQAQTLCLSTENRMLRASKCMLEDIVKKKNNTEHTDLPVFDPELCVLSAEKQAQRVKFSAARESTVNSMKKSLLYDVLAKQRETHDTRGYPDKQPDDGVGTASNQKQENKSLNQSLQDEKLFDLSMSTSRQDASRFSIGERKIFRHFLDEAELADEDTQLSPLEIGGANKLDQNISVRSTPTPQSQSTQKGVCSTDLDNTATVCPFNTPIIVETLKSCQTSAKAVVTENTDLKMDQAEDHLEKIPTLKLPASFLSKYRPPIKRQQVMGTHFKAVPNPMAANPAKEPDCIEVSGREQAENEVDLDSACPKEFVEEKVEYLAKNEPRVEIISTSLSTILSPVRKSLDLLMQDHVKVSPGSRKVALLTPDTKIKWAMGSLVPVFDNEGEKLGARRNLANEGSYFWQHPVRFLPDPTEKNLYRTVMIDYIPQGATYHDVLARVHTGALESIQLFPPLRGSTHYFTARVVFHYELPAAAMALQYQKRIDQGNPIQINDSPVRIWQVLQPTYPANKRLEMDIFQHGYTRILLLEHIEDAGVLPRLHEKLVPELAAGAVIMITRTEDGVPMIEFTSVSAAVAVMRRFQGDREFSGCIFDFDEDYCDDPYDGERVTLAHCD